MIVSFIGVIGKFMGGMDDMCVGDVGDFFCLCWGVGFYFIVVGGVVVIVQIVFQVVVSYGQVIYGGDQGGRVVGQLQVFSWQFVQQNVFQIDFVEVFRIFVVEVWEVDVCYFIMVVQQVQMQFNFFVSFIVVLFEVLFVFVVLVEFEGVVWYGYVVFFVKGDGFLFWIVFLIKGIYEVGCVQCMVGGIIIVVFFEYYQYWYVGIVVYIVGEILVWFIEVEFMQYYMVYCQCYCGIGILFWCQLQIVEFGDFGVVWSDGYGFGFFIVDFGKEVCIWGVGLWYVGVSGDNIVGVILVGGFWYIGLFVSGYW